MTHAQANQVAYLLDNINRKTGAEQQDFINRLKLYCFQKGFDQATILSAIAPGETKEKTDPPKSKNKVGTQARVCLECGTDISEKKSSAKFCDVSCRVKHNRNN
jgi:hypothetical protein